MTSLNTARRAHTSLCTKNGIFVVGGYDGVNFLSSVEFYEEETDKWYIVSFLNIPRCLHSSVVSFDGNGILVFGGFNEQPLASVEFMDVFDKKWGFRKEMNRPLCMHSTLLLDFDD